jgi:hypothetical protein
MAELLGDFRSYAPSSARRDSQSSAFSRAPDIKRLSQCEAQSLSERHHAFSLGTRQPRLPDIEPTMIRQQLMGLDGSHRTRRY